MLRKVRFGSFVDVIVDARHPVRSAPKATDLTARCGTTLRATIRTHAVQQNWSLFDHLVGEASSIGGTASRATWRVWSIDDKLELRRLHTGRSAGLAPLRMRPM